ncbi:sigma-70 family RNA polymerase sigma factor [Treponema parvum]|uniref:Sigma-70 family RNA polymerase sigma factor n=1 Tax=Treponema parvum TaxID=138851 RepID=A0A975F0W2_9SPIR|nr:sigma-70 family RNA polymerase sigma factor [Treponema parvum]QTQ12323.1 sigma-70 family RNA polymerase sigma factor [Treponema parvum]
MPIDSAARIKNKLAIKRDYALAKAALKGDTKSFAVLMKLYKRRIEILGISFFKNTADTEDFVQEVFLRAYTKLSSFQGKSLFSTWLTRIAYNMAVNAVNRRKEYMPIADEDSLVAPDLSPEERQIRKTSLEAVRLAINELPERFAVCLDMYFFYDIPYAEISEITGFPVNTIKSHIFRAKQILRDKLEEAHFDF